MSAKPFLTDLDSVELAALRSYKAGEESDGISLCFDTNRGLRNGLRVDELEVASQDLVRALDKVFARVSTTESQLKVFRGVGIRVGLPLHESEFRSLQFWSTAIDEEAVAGFLRDDGAILVLDLPPGSPVYDLETLPGFGGHERELLLPRGMRWRVGAVTKLIGAAVPEYARYRGVSSLVRAELTAVVPYRPPLD